MSTSEERIKHLEFIQAVITRQASHSFSIKGWSLTVAGAIYAYTAENIHAWIAVIAILLAIAFAWLDLFYLRQERLFRDLYDDVAMPDSKVPLFSLNTLKYQDKATYPKCSYRGVAKSRPWWVLHLAIVAVGIALVLVAVF